MIFCCACKEEFPLGQAGRMGQLAPLTVQPPWIRERFASWLDHGDGAYLCGNCYFDQLDAREDALERCNL